MSLPAFSWQFCWFGQEVAFSFGPTTVADDAEFEAYQDAGTTGSTAIGFTRSSSPKWEAPGSYHQFEPDEAE